MLVKYERCRKAALRTEVGRRMQWKRLERSVDLTIRCNSSLKYDEKSCKATLTPYSRTKADLHFNIQVPPIRGQPPMKYPGFLWFSFGAASDMYSLAFKFKIYLGYVRFLAGAPNCRRSRPILWRGIIFQDIRFTFLS